MNAKVSNVSFRVDTSIKKKADRLFSELGLNMTTAFNIFLRQSVREGCIPFNVTTNTPNAKTVAAMREAERIAKDPSIKRYANAKDALRELKK
jgi:DNA-damage-inducible protein J